LPRLAAIAFGEWMPDSAPMVARTTLIGWRKAQVELAEKDGTLTKEQAELYRSHIEQMEKFHAENGFANGMGFGACGGSFSGNNSRSGFGRGMMGGVY
jgi:hypothetical protein